MSSSELKSTSPLATDCSGLPSNSGTIPTQTSSTGSVSSSTSYPLALNASRCGDFSSCWRVSPVA
ncbi:Uncharacterised protein [Mycobacterium tuberculosis]|uniref:Uncharacterized protein n=1 Tax=Mycobacterium tuberculosis TaxID=1773 RepID=A0A916L841_MYCTX|nr:Uncharacterised protein [Mycobacterium tuberculosis]COW37243.1 Uncharacterised protein [Mycobacterium tuberculosis]COW94477.1 Uncharacterised protein [Mycobacterium tuberculosis]COW96092.1 Uncharacterised protein [Mycobacterium tuberculosis]